MTHLIPGPRRAWNAIPRPARRFRIGRRGAVAVFLAFAIIPLIGFVGIATDTARAYLVKSRLSSALDAGATLPSGFMRVFGYETMTVTAEAELRLSK